MLVLSRQRDETLIITNMDTGENIEVIVVGIRGDKARLGVNASQKYAVHRKEVYEAIQRRGGNLLERLGKEEATQHPTIPIRPKQSATSNVPLTKGLTHYVNSRKQQQSTESGDGTTGGGINGTS